MKHAFAILAAAASLTPVLATGVSQKRDAIDFHINILTIL
jgi:hypothetical protein